MLSETSSGVFGLERFNRYIDKKEEPNNFANTVISLAQQLVSAARMLPKVDGSVVLRVKMCRNKHLLDPIVAFCLASQQNMTPKDDGSILLHFQNSNKTP